MGPMPIEAPLATLPIACCPPLAGPTISFEEATGTASLFKALADPHRVLILNRLLASDEPVCVCELNEELDLAQPTVSFHLKKMVNAGLLQREKRATWAYYSVTPAAVEALSQLFEAKETVR
jgi:ArsR family transcriptional regulator, arsenate/arsenite/antimonite-responsive transcriptional repressor